MAKSQSVDFTNVKEGGGFSKAHLPAGDYLAKITKVDDAPSKKDGVAQWLFTMQLTSRSSATYPYYCKLQENQLWKLRNLLVAAGLNVPKAKVKVDPTKVVGKTVAVSLDDTEYNDKMQSEITAVFPAADLQGAEGPAEEDDDDEEEEDTEETDVEEPDAETEEEDDEEEEEEEPAPPPVKKAKKKAKAKPVAEVDDDELEELDIEEI